MERERGAEAPDAAELDLTNSHLPNLEDVGLPPSLTVRGGLAAVLLLQGASESP